MPKSKILDGSKTALVVIDLQEAFRSVIGDFALIASRISVAVRGFRILGATLIVTEQYPKGLGKTAEEVMLSLPDNFEIIEKSAFSCLGENSFGERLREHNVEQVVLCGVEAHVCVSQTAHDLLDQGFEVHIFTDCVGSRFEHDKQAGLAKMMSDGAVPSSVEMALFEMMRGSDHERFKEIQNLIK